MPDLHFDFEWIDPLSARGPELRSTFARFRIQVGDQLVTKVFDRHAKGVRDSVFLPLYPLAEWIASNWWFLQAEVESPGRHSSADYFRRHCVRFGQEGFALPALVFQPIGEQVLLKWEPVATAWADVEFLSEGATYVDKNELVHTLREFIEAILVRLEDEGIGRTPLLEEWQAITDAATDVKEFCLAAAALGEDPYTLDEHSADHLIAITRNVPRGVMPELLNTATLGTIAEQARAVEAAVAESLARAHQLRRLRELRSAVEAQMPVFGRPWDLGYQLAERTRAELGLNGARLNTNDALERALGFDQNQLWGAIPTISASGVDGLATVSAEEAPGFSLANRGDEALRFGFSRALCEYLIAPAGAVQLVTRAHSEKQKANRAFAAEFLVPAFLLRNAVSADVVGSDAVDDLSAAFGVSPFVITHQLENHGIARVSLG